MNEETPKFEGENTPEKSLENTPEETDQWSAEDEKNLEILKSQSLARDRADLEKLRTEMGLPIDGPDIENVPADTQVVEDILAKTRAKGLVFNDMNETVNDKSLEQLSPQQKLEKALESGDARAIDHASRAVFKEARQSGDWDTSRDMIELASDPDGRQGRIAVWEKESGQKYLSTTIENNTADQSENKTEQQEPITNTASFNEAIKNGFLTEAKAWFMDVKDNKYAGNVDWIDKASRALFKAARQAGDFLLAKEMIQHASDENGRQGRIAVWEKESGQKYKSEENKSHESQEKSADLAIFAQMIDSGDLPSAGEWLFENKTELQAGGAQNFLNSASSKLFDEFMKTDNLELALKMISMNDDDQTRQEMRRRIQLKR